MGMANMNEATCPICGLMIKPDTKDHLTDQHKSIDTLHLRKLEDRVITLEKYRGFETNE
jgi:hypothetical protein